MNELKINVELTEEQVADLNTICEYDGISIEQRVLEFLIGELAKKPISIESRISKMLASMGHPNVTIISSPTISISESGKLVSPNNPDSRIYTVSTFNCDLTDFIQINKDKKIFLYLSEFQSNNRVRAIVL